LQDLPSALGRRQVLSAPQNSSPGWQGLVSLHSSPSALGRAQRPLSLQRRGNWQAWSESQGAPSAARVSHFPQKEVSGVRQKPLWHCPPEPQAAPVPSVPLTWQAGTLLPKRSSQLAVPRASAARAGRAATPGSSHHRQPGAVLRSTQNV